MYIDNRLFLDRARVPVARYFAAGHGEFAVSVPGGHADIFREKISFPVFLFSLCLPSFFPHLSTFLFLHTLSFIFPFIFSYSSLKESNHAQLRIETSMKSPVKLKFCRAH